MPQPVPIAFNKDDEDEIRLRRLAIEIVAQLPHGTATAQRVLEFAQQVLLWRLRE